MVTRKAHILVVDDERTVRATLTMAFEHRPYRISSVESAEEALPYMERRDVDLVLLDKNLPGMSGTEFLRQLRQLAYRTLVVFLTGYGSLDTARECLLLGVDGYLEKPFENIFKVVEFIDSVLERSGRGDGAADLPQLMASLRHSQEQLSRAVTRHSSEQLSRAATPSYDATGLTMILALPDADERQWLAQRLDGNRDHLIHVATLPDFWQQLASACPDLVIADLAFAGFEPLDLVDEILRICRDVQIAVVAFKPNLKTLSALINNSVRVILEKPLRDDDFSMQLRPMIKALRVVRVRECNGEGA